MHRLALLALILPLAVLSLSSLSGCKEQAGKTLEVKIQGGVPLHAVVNVGEDFFASVKYLNNSTTAPVLEFRWDVLSGPTGSASVAFTPGSGSVADPSSGITTSMNFSIPGSYVLRITVLESTGNISASDTQTWVVAATAGG
jgi:hypothetical protein